MKITPVQLGLPAQTGTDLLVRVISFDTDARTCNLYYEVKSENGHRLAEGNVSLTEEEFINCGFNNPYVEDLSLNKLGLTRAKEVETKKETKRTKEEQPNTNNE